MHAVDLYTLNRVWMHMEGRVRYKLGAKAPSLTCDSSLIEEIDCSGFVRYAIARATNQEVILPDGSQCQLDWCRQVAHLTPVGYARAAEAMGGLYIAFLSPDPGHEWPRHVWLVRQKTTRESCGSMGVCARPALHPKLVDATACFLLPSEK